MKKTLCILLSVLLLAALLCGCGGSGKSSYASSGASSSYYSKSGGETEAAMDTGWAMTEPMAPEAQKSEGMAQQTSASLPAKLRPSTAVSRVTKPVNCPGFKMPVSSAKRQKRSRTR